MTSATFLLFALSACLFVLADAGAIEFSCKDKCWLYVRGERVMDNQGSKIKTWMGELYEGDTVAFGARHIPSSDTEPEMGVNAKLTYINGLGEEAMTFTRRDLWRTVGLPESASKMDFAMYASPGFQHCDKSVWTSAQRHRGSVRVDKSATRIWGRGSPQTVVLRTLVGVPRAGCANTSSGSSSSALECYLNGELLFRNTEPMALSSADGNRLRKGDVIACKGTPGDGPGGIALRLRSRLGIWDTSNATLWAARPVDRAWDIPGELKWAQVDFPDACDWATAVPATPDFRHSTYVGSGTQYIWVEDKFWRANFFRTVIGIGKGNRNCHKEELKKCE